MTFSRPTQQHYLLVNQWFYKFHFLWQSQMKSINYILLYIINRNFICRCYIISQNSTNIYKKSFAFFAITFPLFVVAPFPLNLVVTGLYFLLFITVLITCQDVSIFDLCSNTTPWKCFRSADRINWFNLFLHFYRRTHLHYHCFFSISHTICS